MAGVVLPDQRLAVHARGTSDGADVPARIEVAAAAGELVSLDRGDQRRTHPGGLTDIGDRQAARLAGSNERVADHQGTSQWGKQEPSLRGG